MLDLKIPSTLYGWFFLLY